MLAASAASRQDAVSSVVTHSAFATSGWRLQAVGGDPQIVRGHEIGEDVVAHDRRVLVGAGDTVEVPDTVTVVMAQGHPEPGCFDQQFQPAVGFEVLVPGDDAVALEGHRDVGVDVPGCRAGRPVGRALLSADGPPRERGAVQSQFGGPLLGQIQGRGPPPQRVGHGVRRGIGEHRQHVSLGVPEGMAVIAGSGEPLGGDRAAFGAGTGLQQVEEPESHGLLGFGVTLDLDVGAVPEVVQIFALRIQQALPSGVAGAVQRGGDLVAQCRARAHARPAVRQVLDDA